MTRVEPMKTTISIKNKEIDEVVEFDEFIIVGRAGESIICSGVVPDKELTLLFLEYAAEYTIKELEAHDGEQEQS